jgi:hypothetical protein
MAMNKKKYFQAFIKWLLEKFFCTLLYSKKHNTDNMISVKQVPGSVIIIPASVTE